MGEVSGGGVRRNFNYSNVMSTLAVFLVVSGGTAMAAKIDTNELAKKAVTNKILAKDAVKTTSKIGAGAVATDDVANAAITAAKLAPGVVPSSTTPTGPAGGDLTGTYPNPLVGNNTISTDKLQDNAVTSAKIADANVTTDDLADNAVTSAKIADANVGTADLANNSVSNAKIQNDAVTETKIAANSVSADELNAITVVQQTTPAILPGANDNLQVNCPAGAQVIAGGAFPSAFGVEVPSNTVNGNGWFAAARNNTGVNQTLTVRASCLEA